MKSTTTEFGRQRRFCSVLIVLAAAVVCSLLFGTSMSSAEVRSAQRRQLDAQFADPKTVTLRSDSPMDEITSEAQAITRDNNCQIVYLLGVEGVTHHGFIPIIEELARQQHQVDPKSGTDYQYRVDAENQSLKAGLFGWHRARRRAWGFAETPPVDDPELVQRVVKSICPNDGKKYVVIEWASFPSGHEDDPRDYRVHRQHDWLSMSSEEIADSDLAQQQPFNLTAFIQAYSPYVDVKFVVLHRPFLETILSHRRWDGGPEIHSNIIRGFLLILSRFLAANPVDLVTGNKLWELVCTEWIMAKNYKDNLEGLTVAREDLISHLALFLGWPVLDCPTCFDKWVESKKDISRFIRVRPSGVEMMQDHMKILEGVWPPTIAEWTAGQQCGM